MPEYMEVVIFRLVLLSLLVLGVSLLTNIHVNERCMAPAKGADPNVLNRAMIAPINPRGTERDPDGFLGETGARVMDVQNTGNLLGMLLQSTRDDSYRVLTWTFRQGCALDWFPSGPAEEGEKPNLYPASYFQRFRSRMAFWFCFANLFGGGKEVLAQIDCTNNMNQADWNMYTVPADFEFSRGWFDRFSGNVSILEQPTVWMARVRADFERRLARDGRDLPAVIWMGDKEGSPVWKGIGYKSKSESLNQFWKNTGIGVFVTLGELEKKGPSGEDRLTDLCLSVIMFLRSEAWVGK